jgi:hypothetical protein
MQHAFKSTDLAPDERVAVERLVGRAPQNDEAAQLVIHKLGAQENGGKSMSRSLPAERIREMAKGKRLGGAAIRELIDDGRRF